MEVRLAEITEEQEIRDYCKEYGFHFPVTNSLFVAKQNGQLIGLGGLEVVVKIEPFIASSPISAKRLYDELLHIVRTSTTVNKIECFTPDIKFTQLKPLYNKLGFVFAEKTNRFIKHL